MKRIAPLLLILALALTAPALAEPGGPGGVAEALGLRSVMAAAAVETGAGEAWNRFTEEKDPTIRTMNAERSHFLRNAPGAIAPLPQAPQAAARAALAPKLAVVRDGADVERNLALQQLEFRRNVEDAMKRILSFSPAIRAIPAQEYQQAGGQPAPQGESFVPLSGGARDRLVQSAVGAPDPFRGLKMPKQPEVASADRPIQPAADQRVIAPPRFESSAEDDAGKPVRNFPTGSPDDTPVIDLRRGSGRAPTAAVLLVPAGALPPLPAGNRAGPFGNGHRH